MKRILVVEDNSEVQIILKHILAKDYALQFANTLAEARQFLQDNEVDLLLLDIMLPDGDGLRFCAEVKSSKGKKLPVLILSARTGIEDKALGFQLGIDDFITKPFDPLEVKIRVDARIKKELDAKGEGDTIRIGDITIYLAKHRVEIDQQTEPVTLTAKEFGILVYLAQQPEVVKTRAQILDEVWGSGVHLTDRSVDSHISRLRKRLEKSSTEIESVKNTGYRISQKKKQQKAA